MKKKYRLFEDFFDNNIDTDLIDSNSDTGFDRSPDDLKSLCKYHMRLFMQNPSKKLKVTTKKILIWIGETYNVFSDYYFDENKNGEINFHYSLSKNVNVNEFGRLTKFLFNYLKNNMMSGLINVYSKDYTDKKIWFSLLLTDSVNESESSISFARNFFFHDLFDKYVKRYGLRELIKSICSIYWINTKILKYLLENRTIYAYLPLFHFNILNYGGINHYKFDYTLPENVFYVDKLMKEPSILDHADPTNYEFTNGKYIIDMRGYKQALQSTAFSHQICKDFQIEDSFNIDNSIKSASGKFMTYWYDKPFYVLYGNEQSLIIPSVAIKLTYEKEN